MSDLTGIFIIALAGIVAGTVGDFAAAAAMAIMVGYIPLPNQAELFEVRWENRIVNASILAALIASRGRVVRSSWTDR